jgi:hypothetical protein
MNQFAASDRHDEKVDSKPDSDYGGEYLLNDQAKWAPEAYGL